MQAVAIPANKLPLNSKGSVVGGADHLPEPIQSEATSGHAWRCNRDDQAYLRRSERWLGLQLLGLAQPTVLSLALRSGLVGRQKRWLFERLASLLHPTDVVVSTWEHDGHPDHDTTGAMARRASAAVGCAYLAAPVWMWRWATPGDARVPWLRLRGLPLGAADGLRKQAALAAHRSQLLALTGEQGAALSPAIVERAAWRTEYFFV